jgi:hypothetical protein
VERADRDPSLLTLRDLERDSQLSVFTWRRYIEQGAMPAIRIGSRIRVEVGAYEKFLRERRIPRRRRTKKSRRIPTSVSGSSRPPRGGRA